MNKETIVKMAREYNCGYEMGLNSEIDDFLEEHNNVQVFQRNFHEDENCCYVEIQLKEYSMWMAKELFMEIVFFIQYSSTFYVREKYSDKIEYLFLSSMEDGKSIFCKFTFKEFL